MAALVHVLARTHNRFSGSAHAAICERRQLGTVGSPQMGSGSGQLVPDVPLLASSCSGPKETVCLGQRTAGSRATGQIPGALWRGQDPLLSQCSIFLGSRTDLLRRLGDPL